MRTDLARRLDKLTAAVRPEHSLAAKIEALDPCDRATYDQWRSACAVWHKQFTTPDGAFEAFLDGNLPTRLHSRISTQVFGPDVEIEETATLEQARDTYNLQMEKR